jgi:hypothetical protein
VCVGGDGCRAVVATAVCVCGFVRGMAMLVWQAALDHELYEVWFCGERARAPCEADAWREVVMVLGAVVVDGRCLLPAQHVLCGTHRLPVCLCKCV